MKENGKRFTVALLLNKGIAQKLLHDETMSILKSFAKVQETDQLPVKLDEEYINNTLSGCDACITSWGTPRLTEPMIEKAAGLKLIAHAAGSVKHLVPANAWDRNIRVTSAAPIIAKDVAETTLGLIIMSMKRIPLLSNLCRNGQWWCTERESPLIKPMYNSIIGIIGASMVGRNVIRLLKSFELTILLYDPFVSEQQAKELGVVKASLEDLMAKSDLVSVHAPEIKETYHIINKSNLSLMKDGAILINTARGSLVDEDALIKELKTGRIFACLDVTSPEPPDVNNPLRIMDNVILTPHIAGTCSTMGRQPLDSFIVRQVHSFLTEGILEYEVTKERLSVIA